MRWCFLLLLSLLVSACREIEPLTPPETVISGYQLNGTVTTTNGTSIPGVAVVLWYSISVVQWTPWDTLPVVVIDPTKILDIIVVTSEGAFVRRLSRGLPRQTGPVPRPAWDFTDDNGNPVPTGVYLIRYSIDDSVVKESPVLVGGRRTTVTDSTGRFTLPPGLLPVGTVFDVYSGTGTFLEAVRVDPEVDLVFTWNNTEVPYQSVSLTQNRITTRVFVL